MNLLVVGNLYPPIVFGGYEILCRQVVEGLRRRGHRVAVLTSGFGLDLGPLPPEPEVTRTLDLTTPFPRPGEDVGFVDFRLSSLQRVALTNAARTREWLAEAPWRPDLVFCWCLNRLSLGPIFAAVEKGIPVCYTINDEHPRQYRIVPSIRSPRAVLRYILERWIFPMATFRNLPSFPIIVLSKATRRRLIEQGTPIEHAEVIHQGVQLDRLPFRFLPRPAGGPFKLLFVGQISRAKGVHTIVKAVALLVRKRPGLDLQLTVVGTGVPEYQRELQRSIDEEGIAGKVTFAGKVSHDGIIDFHRVHHGFVFSSEWEEPFGLTHLEAMALGTPVISTTTGGSAELIRDGENALAYRAGDEYGLAARISLLADDEPLRAGLAGRARAHVESFYDFEGYLDRVEEFLKRSAGMMSFGEAALPGGRH